MKTPERKSKPFLTLSIQQSLLVLVGLTGSGYAAGYFLKDSYQSPIIQEVLPQGFWGPTHIVGTMLHAEINAYHNHPNLGIEKVLVSIQNANGDWINLCNLEIAERTNTFVCDVDIAEYIGNRNEVTISFDVVATDGKVSYAPSDTRTISVPR